MLITLCLPRLVSYSPAKFYLPFPRFTLLLLLPSPFNNLILAIAIISVVT